MCHLQSAAEAAHPSLTSCAEADGPPPRQLQVAHVGANYRRTDGKSRRRAYRSQFDDCPPLAAESEAPSRTS